MAITLTAVNKTWTEVAADISALTLIQVSDQGGRWEQDFHIELQAATSEPEVSTVGVLLRNGETIPSTLIADIGSSGKLYGRASITGAKLITVS